METLTTLDKTIISKKYGIDPAAFLAVIQIESGGRGFDARTGRLIIQFEPHLFSRELNALGIKNSLTRNGNKYNIEVQTAGDVVIEGQHGIEINHYTVLNGVEGQTAEWKAFELASKIDVGAAIKSTSMGLPQILGNHYARLGFKTPLEMWNYFNQGEVQQVEMLAKFIVSDTRLLKAIVRKDWDSFAIFYNGAGYKQLAKKLNITPYNIQLEKAYNKFKNAA